MSNLKPRQLRAIAALIASDSVEEASARSNIPAITLRRWLRAAEFQKHYREALREVWRAALDDLQKGSIEAVRALRETVRGSGPASAARVSACRVILETLGAVKLAELDERLARVEQVRIVQPPEPRTADQQESALKELDGILNQTHEAK